MEGKWIGKRSQHADPWVDAPSTPEGHKLVSIETMPHIDGGWDHTYYFALAETLYVVDPTIRCYVTNSDKWEGKIPDAPLDFEFDRAAKPVQVTMSKWVHRFHYRPASQARDEASAPA